MVGIVEKSMILDGSQVMLGDKAIALSSSGVHSNGFSLVRKIVAESGLDWDYCPEKLSGRSLGEVLLTPTQIYVKPVLEARRAGLDIHGMAHITGGGLPENLPRCLGKDQSVRIDASSWTVPAIFDIIAQAGRVSPDAMFNTFNMGIGFVLLVPPDRVDRAISWFADYNINAWAIGEVVAGTGSLLGLPSASS